MLSKSRLIYLEVAYTSTVQGEAKLFWDDGNGLREKNSRQTSVYNTQTPKTLRLLLPNIEIKGLRFDPIDRPGGFKIKSIQLANTLGKKVEFKGATINILDYAQLTAKSLEKKFPLTFESDTSDPQILINCDYENLSKRLSENFKKRQTTNRIFETVILSFLTIALCYTGSLLFRSWFVPMVLACVSWALFFPGVYSPDSISQIEEALHHTYFNWHPPIVAITIHYLMEIGLPISGIILLQSIAGFTGIYFLLSTFGELISKFTKFNLGSHTNIIISLVALLILTSPLTPLLSFLNTLWKDVWFAISLIWLIGISCYSFLRPQSKKKWILIPVAIVFMVLTQNLRYNAIFLIPFFAAIIWILTKGSRPVTRIIFILAVIIGCLYSSKFISTRFQVTDRNPRVSVMSLEMVGLAVTFSDLMVEFPYTRSQLGPLYRENFHWAGYRYMAWGDNQIVNAEFVASRPNPELKKEYWYAVKKYPFKMIWIKMKNFSKLLYPFTATEWCPRGVAENDLGLKENELFYKLRHRYILASNAVLENKALKLFSAVNLVWVSISLILLTVFPLKISSEKRIPKCFILLILSIPVIYYFSYLAATPWYAFRYFFPATLIVQTFILSLLFSAIANHFKFGDQREIDRN